MTYTVADLRFYTDTDLFPGHPMLLVGQAGPSKWVFHHYASESRKLDSAEAWFDYLMTRPLFLQYAGEAQMVPCTHATFNLYVPAPGVAKDFDCGLGVLPGHHVGNYDFRYTEDWTSSSEFATLSTKKKPLLKPSFKSL